MTEPAAPEAGPVPEASEQVSMTSAVASGGLWTIIGQLVGLVTALVATPFTIRLLGPARYGLWSLLQTTTTWVGLADFGMAGASTRFAGDAHAHHDDEGEAVATWTAAIVSVLATAAVAAAVAFFAPWVVREVLHVRHGLRGTGATALRIVTAAVVFSAASANLGTPLAVRLRWRTSTAISQGFSIAQVVAIPVLLETIGGGVITTATVAAVAGAGGLLALWLVAVRLQPAMRRPHFSRKMARRLLVFGGALTVAGVADIPLTTAERVLLGHYKSTVELAYYAVAMRLATLASLVPAAASQPLFPAVIRLQARGEHRAARDLYSQILKGAFLILTPLLLLVALVAQPFLSFWAGHAYGVHSAVPCFVLLVGVWFSSLSWLPLTYLMAVDRGGTVARLRLLEIVPYVVGAAVLTSSFGAIGAAAVWSARMVVDATAFFVVAKRFEGLSLSPLSDRSRRAALLPALLCVLVVLLSLTTSGFPLRAGCAVAIVPLYAGVAWFAVLADNERTAMRRLAVSINPFRRGRPELA
jgi:O-antigen/teichoic acid export membrane protein